MFEAGKKTVTVSRLFIVSTALVALAVICALAVVVVTLWPEDNATEIAESATTPTSSPEASTVPDENASLCGLPGGDHTTIDSPPEVEWEFVGTMHAPTSADVGPGQITDSGFRQCYAHSPEGALMAAANVMAMGTDPLLVQELNEEQVAEGPGRDLVLEDLENNAPESDADIRLTIVGYNLMGYAPNASRIDLAVEGSNGVFASITTDLRWEDGDWKVALSDSGQPVIPVTQIADASDYHPWKAEG